MIETLIIVLSEGLAKGMVLFLVAAGLTVIFGVLGVLNFAHGSFYMLGAYLTFFIATGSGPLFFESFWIGVVLAAIIVGFIGAILEVTVIRPTYDMKHGAIYQLLLTFGLLLIIDSTARWVWGTEFQSINLPSELSFRISVAGVGILAYDLFLIGFGFVMALTIWLLFTRTSIGRNTRAAAENADMANVLGVNVPVLFTIVFFAGSAIAGLGGALASAQASVSPDMGESVIIESFIVVVLGGLGSFAGAFIGALLIGLADAVVFQLAPQFRAFVPFALMAIVLLVQPAGLLGEEGEH